MIFYVVARKDGTDKTYDEWLKPSLDSLGVKNENIIQLLGKDSIFQKYNKAIDILSTYSLKPNDIIVFVHDDVRIVDKECETKLEKLFDKVSNAGVVGVIGTGMVDDRYIWWSHHLATRGQIIQHHPNGNKNIRPTYKSDGVHRVLTVDGLFMAVSWKTLGNYRFDVSLPGYHRYDMDFCFTYAKNKYFNLVAPIMVEHKSEGAESTNQEFEANRKVFMDKWGKKHTLEDFQ